MVLPAVIWSCAQDTQLSVLLCVVGIGLALSASVVAQWCSGTILFALFSIKGVTALDFPFVLAAAFAIGDQRRLLRVITSAGLATVLTALAYAAVLRVDLDNLLLAAQIRPGSHWPGSLHAAGRFVLFGWRFAEHNPVILIALLALAAVTVGGYLRSTKDRRLLAFAIVVWLVPPPAVFAQHEFFGYHYQGFVLSSWLCLGALYLVRGGQWSDFFRIRLAPRMARMPGEVTSTGASFSRAACSNFALMNSVSFDGCMARLL